MVWEKNIIWGFWVACVFLPQRSQGYRRSGFSREYQSIVFNDILFRLDGELLFLQQRKKSNQKNAAPTSLPFGFPHHSPLPTGRPDSPSGLDRTKFDVRVEFSLPKPNGSANFTGRMSFPSSSPKPASLIGSIDQGRSIESRRAWMRVETTRGQ
jgi:hypothetical protein